MLVAMQKVSLYALQAEREKLLEALQKQGELMLLEPEDNKPMPCAEVVAERLAKAQASLAFLSTFTQPKSLFAAKATVPYATFKEEVAAGQTLTQELLSLKEASEAKRKEAAELLKQAAALAPWQDLPLRLEELAGTASTTILAGYVPEAALEALTEECAPLICHLEQVGVGSEGKAILIIAHSSCAAKVQNLAKKHSFLAATFPKEQGYVRDVSENMKRKAAFQEEAARQLEQQARDLSAQRVAIELYCDQLANKKERMAVAGAQTEKTFHLVGWCRADKVAEVERTIAQVTAIYEVTFTEPEEGEVPPSLMENKAVVAPYEAVVELYSRPQVGSLDPCLVMAPFHCIFFGMMLSDAGYGVVLTILLYLLLKVFKPQGFAKKLGLVVLMGSISTIIWGAAFGGWFGIEYKPLLFVPMAEPLKMLALCFALGGLHIVTGVVLKLYSDVRKGDYIAAIADDFSWLLIFAGLILLVVGDGAIGKVVAAVGALLIVAFGGRSKKNIFARLLSGTLGLYNISGYLSDLLSYSRLFALGLATGVIAMVINTIASMLMAAGPVGVVAAVFVLIGGHVFNIIINILGAFVHASRLQYIEFFGKFFEAGGRAFVPLALRTTYVDIKN